MQHGFVMQNIIRHGTETWVYLYNAAHDISISYAFDWDHDTLLLAIVTGDVYTRFYHAGVGEHSGPTAPPAPPEPPAPPTAQFYAQFPFIPDFQSVSNHAALLFEGTPGELGLAAGSVFYDLYDFIFVYSISQDVWIPDTDAFDRALAQNGFFLQNIVRHGNNTWVYHFHAGRNVSLSYVFEWDNDLLSVLIVPGDAYTAFYHGGVQEGGGAVGGGTNATPAIVGNWIMENTNDDYFWDILMDDMNIIYIFEADGFGYWAIACAIVGTVFEEYLLIWEVVGDTIIVTFLDDGWVYVYYFDIFIDNNGNRYLDLELDDGFWFEFYEIVL